MMVDQPGNKKLWKPNHIKTQFGKYQIALTISTSLSLVFMIGDSKHTRRHDCFLLMTINFVALVLTVLSLLISLFNIPERLKKYTMKINQTIEKIIPKGILVCLFGAMISTSSHGDLRIMAILLTTYVSCLLHFIYFFHLSYETKENHSQKDQSRRLRNRDTEHKAAVEEYDTDNDSFEAPLHRASLNSVSKSDDFDDGHELEVVGVAYNCREISSDEEGHHRYISDPESSLTSTLN